MPDVTAVGMLKRRRMERMGQGMMEGEAPHEEENSRGMMIPQEFLESAGISSEAKEGDPVTFYVYGKIMALSPEGAEIEVSKVSKEKGEEEMASPQEEEKGEIVRPNPAPYPS